MRKSFFTQPQYWVDQRADGDHLMITVYQKFTENAVIIDETKRFDVTLGKMEEIKENKDHGVQVL